ADVHERRLHARQDVRHRALVHAAHDGPVAMALEIELGEEITLLDGDPGFEQTDVDDDAFAHGSIPPTPATAERAPGASLELPHPDREEESEGRHGDDHRGAAVAHERHGA